MVGLKNRYFIIFNDRELVFVDANRFEWTKSRVFFFDEHDSIVGIFNSENIKEFSQE